MSLPKTSRAQLTRIFPGLRLTTVLGMGWWGDAPGTNMSSVASMET